MGQAFTPNQVYQPLGRSDLTRARAYNQNLLDAPAFQATAQMELVNHGLIRRQPPRQSIAQDPRREGGMRPKPLAARTGREGLQECQAQ